MELEEDPDGQVLTKDEWTHVCAKVDRLEGGMENEMEGSSSTYDESYAGMRWRRRRSATNAFKNERK